MTTCLDFLPLLRERACGTLPGEAAGRLDAHLAACAACRAEATADDEVLSLVRLPPPGQAERAALDGLAEALLEGQQRPARRWRWPALGGAALAAGALAAALLVTFDLPAPAAPAPAPAAPLPSEQATSATWSEPDPAELWDASGVLEEDVASADGGGDDLALTEVMADDVLQP